MSLSTNDGDWTLRWSNDGDRMDASARGTLTFAEDLSDVQTLSDGGFFSLHHVNGGLDRKVEIRSSAGTLTRRYWVSGTERPWDEDARRWLASELPVVIRRTGLGAGARVKSILQKRGVRGVLDEIALLESDYVRRVYFVALVDDAQLDSATVVPVLQQVGSRITSDYDRRQVLERIASAVKLDDRATAAYAQALSSMRSSYDKRLVLTRLISRGSLTDHVKKSVLTSAAEVTSDYDRAEILLAYEHEFGVDSALRDPFFAALGGITSDYDKRRVLTALVKTGTLSADVQSAAFELVQSMRSDYDRAEALLAFVQARAVASSSRAAFITAAESIRSQYDQNRVLAALTKSEGRDGRR
jgi:hypothetical protein